MSKFIYQAKNDHGQLVKGEVQAANEVVAEKLLMRNKLIVLSLEPETSWLSSFSILNKVSLKDKSRFARQLATMIAAGLPLVQALNIILTQTKNSNFKNIIASVIRDVEAGYTFSTSIAKHPGVFNKVFVSIVRSGEATGKLDDVLLELADQLEKDVSMTGRIRGAMVYPIFIIAAMIGIGALMMVMVIPTIKEVFLEANAELPWATKMLILMSDVLIQYWYLVIVAVVALVVGIKVYFSTESGKRLIDLLSIKTPVLKDMIIGVLMSRLTRTLGLLVASGIPILEALRIVGEAMNNHYYRDGLEEVRAQVERGVPMSVPLMKDSHFPPLFGQMVAVGEQTGQVDTMLGNLAKYYTEDADNKLKSVSSLIEPVIMLILGVGVAVLVFAIMMPIYNIASIGG